MLKTSFAASLPPQTVVKGRKYFHRRLSVHREEYHDIYHGIGHIVGANPLSPPPPTSRGCHRSERYASCWNAFLLVCKFRWEHLGNRVVNNMLFKKYYAVFCGPHLAKTRWYPRDLLFHFVPKNTKKITIDEVTFQYFACLVGWIWFWSRRLVKAVPPGQL